MIPAINLATVPQTSMAAALPLCRQAGFEGVGLWFEPVSQLGIAETCKILDDCNLRVTSLCPSGSFGDHGEAGFDQAVAHTKAAIEMTAALEADCLCILPGSYPRDRTDLQLARDFARRGFDAVVAYARENGVTLAIEPLHPMYTDGFSVVNTTREALDWCEEYGVCLFIDSYHVWWDDSLEDVLRQRGHNRVAGFHVNDWRRDTEDLVEDRDIPGEGIIDLERIFRAVRATEYNGAAEIEIFSKRYARDDPSELLRRCRGSLEPYLAAAK
jgi:sugar phosphate isomerase/epimerase